jgi:hypothetical protein
MTQHNFLRMMLLAYILNPFVLPGEPSRLLLSQYRNRCAIREPFRFGVAKPDENPSTWLNSMGEVTVGLSCPKPKKCRNWPLGAQKLAPQNMP